MQIINKLEKAGYPHLLRFFDLTKLLDFLITGTFHFTRLDQFEDKCEAISQKQLVAMFEHDVSLNPTQRKELSLKDRQQRYFATCWFSGLRESIGMWNLYSNTSSVALKIPFSSFMKIWKDSNLEFQPAAEWVDKMYINKIYYKDYLNVSGVESFKDDTKVIGFQKDFSYDHEKEVRVLIKIKGQTGRDESIVKYRDHVFPFIKVKLRNIKDIQMNIIFHPTMASWQKENIKKLIKKYGFKNIICIDSEVTRLLNSIN